MRIGYILLSILFINCGSGADYIIVNSPNGTPAAYISCKRNQGDCFRIAGEVCPHGYDILREDGDRYTNVSGYAMATQSGGFALAKTEREFNGNLFIQCRAMINKSSASVIGYCDTSKERNSCIKNGGQCLSISGQNYNRCFKIN